MPDEDSSQQPAPPESAPLEPVRVAPIAAPVPPEPIPPEPTPVPDAPVADTPVAEPPIDSPIETEPPVEVPVENPIAEPIPPAPVVISPIIPVSNIPPPTPIVTTPEPDHSSSAYLKSLVPLSLAERNRRRLAHIEKLIDHAAANGSTSRREAQLLLKVTGATADRYIRELISQGRLTKENNARYTKYKFVR